jgi:hypothetical protein
MKKIDREASSAFINKRRFKSKNTQVKIENNEAYMYLFGNLIARTKNNELFVNHCGWKTITTRNRLNAFYGVKIRMFHGEFILNEMGYMKDGWINVNKL